MPRLRTHTLFSIYMKYIAFVLASRKANYQIRLLKRNKLFRYSKQEKQKPLLDVYPYLEIESRIHFELLLCNKYCKCMSHATNDCVKRTQ